ncbi:MAG TPA: Fe-S cluster assembly protein SufD [Verrucomicrobiae bacterium]|nr:Fe-S cluster assembly protein SufD [Verrucomicrobiae bacterium]
MSVSSSTRRRKPAVAPGKDDRRARGVAPRGAADPSRDGKHAKDDPFVTAFDRTAEALFGAEPEWLRAARRAGIGHFSELGFPTPKHEDWRFTNVAPIRDAGLAPAVSAGQVAGAGVGRIPGLESNVLVFVDGFFAPALSRSGASEGLRVEALSAAVAAEGDGIVREHLGKVVAPGTHPLVALNTASWRDGALVVFAAGQTVKEPVHLVFLSTGRFAVAPRVLIVCERGSEGSVVESFHGTGDTPCWVNAVTEVAVGDGARMEHTKFQCENMASFHTATVQSRLGRDAYFTSHSIALGGLIARNDINTVLAGQNSTSDLNGLYICRGAQLCDHHTIVDHAVANCASHEFYHGILDERSRGVFNGKIFVRKDAQKTDAKQTNRGLLLSADARIDTKPQLEIFADDVKCTHGATVGRLDREALYYLEARGVNPAEAGRMLTHAFAGEIIGRVAFAPLREYIDRFIFDYLEGLPALR